MVENKIKSERDPLRAQYRGQLSQIVDAAELGAHGPIVHDRVPAIILAGPWLEQWHQVQVGDTQFGEVVDAVGDPLQVPGEEIGIRGVSEHLLMLIPLRVGVPPQIQQPQVGGPLLKVSRRDLHQPVGHLGRMVGIRAGQARQQIGPIALQSCRENNLIMRRLVLEQWRQVRNSHCPQAIGADVSLSAICRYACRCRRL